MKNVLDICEVIKVIFVDSVTCKINRSDVLNKKGMNNRTEVLLTC